VSHLPWLLPTFVVGAVLAAVLGGRVGAALAMPRWAATLLVVAVSAIVAVTLTPQRFDVTAPDPLAPLPQIGPDLDAATVPWWGWLLNDRTLNVALFVPLGLGVALIGRRSPRRVLTAAALLVPLCVEVVQHVTPWLARDSQWQDVLDNTVGVALGLTAGFALRHRPDRRGPNAPEVRDRLGP